MANLEGSSSNKAPWFNGTNYGFWSIRMERYMNSLGFDVWMVVENGYTMPEIPLNDPLEKWVYENNAKAKNAILWGLSNTEFIKFMHCKTTKDILDKLKSIYEGDDKVKQAKIHTYKIEFECL